jgi:hypothetical protein
MPVPVRRGDPGRVTVTLGRRSRRPAALLSRAALPTAVLLAALWAGAPALGSAVSRAGAGSLAAAASPSPARAKRVKLFVVPRRKHGRKPVTLYGIAARTLGDGTRFMEIFRLNKGRLQPTGGRLRNPLVIRPGWILELPKDAHGRGVHLGRVPHVKPRPPKPVPSQSAAPVQSPAPASPPATARSSASGTGSSSFSPFQWSSTGSAFVLGGGVLVLALAGLGTAAAKRRRGRRPGAVTAGGTARAGTGPSGPGPGGAGPGAASPGAAAFRRSAAVTSAPGIRGAGPRRRPAHPEAAGPSGRPPAPRGGATWPEPDAIWPESDATWPEPDEGDRAGAGAEVTAEVAEPGTGQPGTTELHAAVLSASAELGRVAANIAENLSVLAEPLNEPGPGAEPEPDGASGAGQPQPGKREADSDWSFLSLTKSPADR